MYRRDGQSAHSCQVPPEAGGMQRGMVYFLRAGDAISRPFHVRVVPAPTIQIAAVRSERIEVASSGTDR